MRKGGEVVLRDGGFKLDASITQECIDNPQIDIGLFQIQWWSSPLLKISSVRMNKHVNNAFINVSWKPRIQHLTLNSGIDIAIISTNSSGVSVCNIVTGTVSADD